MIVFDAKAKDFSDIIWDSADWSEFYPDAVKHGEAIPSNAPPPRGNAVQLNMFCDASHATDLVTRRSTTGIIFLMNGARVKWYSKRQNTIESSTFGSEFFALKIASEMNDGLRYKLRMFGIPSHGPDQWFLRQRECCTQRNHPRVYSGEETQLHRVPQVSRECRARSAQDQTLEGQVQLQ